MKYKTTISNNELSLSQMMEMQPFKRSPKGYTVFRFDCVDKIVGTKVLRRGRKGETMYAMFEGLFEVYDGEKVLEGRHILVLPTKSCLHKLAGLLFKHDADKAKPITVEFNVDKNYINYDIKLLDFTKYCKV